MNDQPTSHEFWEYRHDGSVVHGWVVDGVRTEEGPVAAQRRDTE